ncbi:hypothetical protein EXIGLDRAFT_724237 [Exidia glandulosa HHB12029]|uniref:Uncharacterized protein n=1 Tax=Exidia glandulosa HHB12029 TaxID=1314781 RepID=A0A165MRZ5_EXIGL|nr:hypothetical protein EXIGLDRAFT_724237 [Exidia glandulosa HHB12029]
MPRVLEIPHELQLIIASYCDGAPTRAHLALMHPSWTSAAEDTLYTSIRIDNSDAFGSSDFLSFCYAVTHNERKAQRVRALRVANIGSRALADQLCIALERLSRLQFLHVPILGATALRRFTDFSQSRASLSHLWLMSTTSEMILDSWFRINRASQTQVQRARFREAILARATSNSSPLRVISLQADRSINPGDKLLRRIQALAPSLSVITSQGFNDIALWPCLYTKQPRRETYFNDCLDALRRAQIPLSAPLELDECRTLELHITSSQFSDLRDLLTSTTAILHDLRRIEIIFEFSLRGRSQADLTDTRLICPAVQPATGVLEEFSIRFGFGVRHDSPDRATLVQTAQTLVDEGCTALQRFQVGSGVVSRSRDEGGEFGSWV